ncbi:MAG: hypothetical protein JW828_10215 [Sedimentisphaerales bacterium]|nr:hypothetical protein [Sedimentisphaerales bacterium]
MERNIFFTIGVTVSILFLNGCTESIVSPPADEISTEKGDWLQNSLVYVEVTAYAYEQFQPWKTPDLTTRSGFGTATGPYEILTTAWNVSDAAFVKLRRHGKNEFLTANVEVVDYESNLCLLTVDPNSAGGPFVPVEFHNIYNDGADLMSYWLSDDGQVKTGRGYLDRAEVLPSTVSYTRFLNWIAGNTGKSSGRGRLYTLGETAIGIACWANTENGETGLIPSETINSFLLDAREGEYVGFAAEGFECNVLRNPDLRRFLKIPPEMSNGIYVRKVYTLGTGSQELHIDDVILSIDGMEIDATGQFKHDVYGQIAYHHLFSMHRSGDRIPVTVWRNGQRLDLDLKAVNFDASEMLIPYYEYDISPEYIVTGGYIFQKLTKNYLSMWGDDWSGKVPPHLYHYYRQAMFIPTNERKDIVLLSYVFPHQINLGYHSLGRLVVKECNGIPITRLSDILVAMETSSQESFHTFTFEQDYPTVVIPKDQLELANTQISALYGIERLSRIHNTD